MPPTPNKKNAAAKTTSSKGQDAENDNCSRPESRSLLPKPRKAITPKATIAAHLFQIHADIALTMFLLPGWRSLELIKQNRQEIIITALYNSVNSF